MTTSMEAITMKGTGKKIGSGTRAIIDHSDGTAFFSFLFFFKYAF